MKRSSLLGAVVTGTIMSGLGLVSAVPVQAVTTGPTVLAVHRDGAVDVSGNSTLGTVAKLSVPAGNWTITATATLVGTDTTSVDTCELVAGTDSYATDATPTAQGPGSSQSIVLLLAHHFAKAGSVLLKCDSDGWTGDVLIRDVHIVAVQVAQLYAGDVTYGTGSPRAFYAQDDSFRAYTNTNLQEVQSISLPAGTWLIHATTWAWSANGNELTCKLMFAGATLDQSFENYAVDNGDRTIAVEGQVNLTQAAQVGLECQDQLGAWLDLGSAMTGLQVGTLKYGQIGGSSTTTGSGSPNVVGGYGGPGGISDTTSVASIGSVSLGAGAWFVTSKLSVAAGGGTPKVTCQLKLSTAGSQARVVLDTGKNLNGWMAMSLTKKTSATSNATVACNQSAGSLGAFYYYLKVWAIKAGTLTDTAL